MTFKRLLINQPKLIYQGIKQGNYAFGDKVTYFERTSNSGSFYLLSHLRTK